MLHSVRMYEMEKSESFTILD
ncbi:hypothetical protein ACRE04_09220 [Streptococcus pneumoniae]